LVDTSSKTFSRIPTYLRISRALSNASFSSRRWPGVRTIERKRPAFIRTCSPTSTFSVAVIVPKSRMF
jgi:hypothetical protein